MLKKIWKKIASYLAIIAILINVFTPLAQIQPVLAQEATPDAQVTASPTPDPSSSASPSPDPTPTPTDTPSPSPENIVTPSPTPSPDPTPEAIPSATLDPQETSPSATPSDWQTTDNSATTINNVELGKTYTAPQDSKVTVNFNKLPDTAGKLTIKQISTSSLSGVNAVTQTAYDISSDMPNGTFEYTLTLPTPTTQNVQVKTSEDGKNFTTVSNVTTASDTLTITGLNHFSIFVVTGVDNTGDCTGASDVNPGGTTACYTTIQAAINAATSGDTINVSAGSYTEQLVIDKNLTITGAGSSSTTIQAPGTLATDPDGAKDIVLITGSSVSTEISGFTIQGPVTGLNFGIYVRDGATANIHDNTIKDVRGKPFGSGDSQYGYAIEVGKYNNTFPYVSQVGHATIINNQIYGYQKAGIECEGTSSNATINGNTVTGAGPTTITAQNGIQIRRGATGTIENNTVTGNAYDGPSYSAMGIFVSYAGSGVIIQNNISNHNSGNVYAYGDDGVQVLNNQVSDSASVDQNKVAGITVQADDAATDSVGLTGVLISGNTVQNNLSGASTQSDGIDIYGVKSGTVSNNTIMGSSYDGILVGGSGNIAFTGNTFSDNGLLVSDSNAAAIDFRGIPSRDWSLPLGNGGANTLGGFTVHNNSFSGNLNSIWNYDSADVDAADNYFGTAVLATIQSKISSNVTFQPYYVDSGKTILSDVVPTAVYVNSTYTDGAADDSHIFGYTGFSKIQDAITEVAASGTVNIAAGIYDEQVVINKNLTLQGAGDSTIIKPSAPSKLTSLYTLGTQSNAFWNGQKLGSVINVNGVGADGVTIKNLEVDGTNLSSAPAGANYNVGISYGETGGTIDSVKVINMDTGTGSPRTYGMWLDAVSTNVSVEVKNSTITHYNKNGINVRGAKITANIHNNSQTISGPGAILTEVPNGILFINGAKGNATNNTIYGNIYTGATYKGSGILLYSAADGITVSNNTIHDSDEAVLINGTNSAIVSGNTLRDGLVGVHLEVGAANNVISNNNILNNTYGIRLDGPGEIDYSSGDDAGVGNKANHNIFTGNTENVRNWITDTFDATNNDWGVYTDAAISSTINGNVNFDPFIGAANAVLAPTVTLDTTKTTVTVNDTTSDSTINIPSGVTNATLDVSGIITPSGEDNTATINGNITLNSTTADGPVTVTIPAGTTISGASTDWSGIINAPTVSTNAAYLPSAPNGMVNSLGAEVEVGFGDVPLTLSSAVRILIQGQGNHSVGYIRSGVFTPITAICNADDQTTVDAQLGTGADCSITVNAGSDLAVWTKHFTQFVTYSQVAQSENNNSSSNNSNNSNSGTTSTSSTNTTPAVSNAQASNPSTSNTEILGQSATNENSSNGQGQVEATQNAQPGSPSSKPGGIPNGLKFFLIPLAILALLLTGYSIYRKKTS